MKDFYSPGEIRFRWEEIEWLLRHYPQLSAGVWPRDHRDTGYYDAPLSKRPRKSQAVFCTPIEFKAELDVRMGLIGEKSSILRDILILGISEQEAAELRGITEDTLRRRYNTAMKLMMGWRRRHNREQKTPS